MVQGTCFCTFVAFGSYCETRHSLLQMERS